jgi:hypothetical protein
MQLIAIATTVLLGATTQAASHNIARGHVHNARSPLFDAKSALADRAVDPKSCDQGALINKLLTIVPTSLVSAMIAQPTPFKNDSPPDFWSKLDDHEKECLAGLWPKAGVQVAATSTPCTDTTITSTLTSTSMITMTDAPSPSSVPAVTSTAPAAASSALISSAAAASSTSCTETTTTITSTITQTFYGTSTVPAPSSGYATAPYSNDTTSTIAASGSGTGVPSSTNPALPTFTAGQGMLSASFISSALAAGVAVAFVVFA